ncbi:uncharacterized protein LOC144663301 [Oculina patagonica]
MISLMQYRVAVGLHYTFLKAREISRCVKGQFWSTLLFMFYLEAIYLPALQRQARLWQMNYYVRFWFTQMWLYRFYLPMVIRLANDVETNPGPFFSVDTSKTVKTAHSTSMKVLAFRLSQLGLRPLDVGGAGDCFFRAVSHQLYGTAAYHSQVRAVGIDHLRNHPEHFIESNVEFSWLEYLNNMSRQGTWCDNLIIQAVANALNCTIYIAESAENFAESNVIHPADTHERPGTTIYIGHLDEVHYVSTAPMENEECNFHGQQSQVATPSKLPAVETEERILFNDKTQVCVTKIDSPILQKYSDTPPINDKAEKRRTYIRQYMQKKRADRQFRERENKQKQQKRKENLENSRKNQREALTSYEQVSPEKFKQRDKKTKTRGRESNLEKVRECQRRRFLKYKEANPEKVKERDKKTITKRRQNNLEKVKECKKRGFLKYKEANPEKVKEMDINKKRKRRENNPEKVKECQRRGFNKYKQTNPEKAQLNYTKYKALLQNARESQNVEINIENKCKDPGQNRKRTKDSGNQDQFQQETCKRKRTDEFVQENKKLKCQRSLDQTMTEQIETFHKNIKCGPEYICTCCDQLWYRSSVTKCNPNVYKVCPQNILKISLTGVKSLNNIEWICSTCHSNLKEGKLPSCAKANKMTFPDKPKVLNLTVLEERLVSPRIPFMQIRELPSGGQLSIHGNVVNVPANVNSTVNVLPRPVNESQTIPIKLKRRLRYKHHYQFQNIRPSKVLEAAKYLVQTSQLFQNEGIQVSDGWLKTLNENNEEWSEFLEKPNSKTSNTVEEIYDTDKKDEENTFVNKNDCNDDSDSDDDWSEERERPSGVMDTLLQEPDMNENGDNIMSFAPAEGNRPLGLFIDRDSEFLSFPTIYCGTRRADNNDRLVPVHYSTICKWELRSQDRRVAQSVPNIFYKLKKLQVKQIQGSASLSLRKCKKKGKKYTAGDLKSAESLEKLIHLDEGFRVFRNLRASPPYFERCKRDLFAMIRQLGKPTWFCSFSAAETRWTHLLKILGRLVDKRDYTDNEIQDMTWQKKSDLIKSDPVTCARNFEHMVQLFLRDIIKSQLKPIG